MEEEGNQTIHVKSITISHGPIQTLGEATSGGFDLIETFCVLFPKLFH